MEWITEASPRRLARVAGAFYLLNFVTGMISLATLNRLVVSGDAAATARDILTHEMSFLLGFATFLLMIASYIGVTALFYVLFRPVNRSLSLMAACFSLVGCAIGAVGSVFLYAPLSLLQGAHVPGGFQLQQVQELAFMSLKLEAQAFNSSLPFFGFYCLLIAYLVYRSTFLPRILGLFMAIAGLGWLTYLSPPLATGLEPYVLVSGGIGEGALTLWLLFKGVEASKWQEASLGRET